jgi:xylan 1,4-beta-xylosidase
VDAGVRGAAWNRFYERGVSSCHANTILSTAYGRNIQNALKKGHEQAGFQYIRFHGILDGDIGVYTESNGLPVYNWERFDGVFDAIVAAGMRPVFEVGFTPPPLASDTSSAANLHWYNNVPANKSKPKDWTKWMNLMTEIVKHLEGRYGAAEVRNNWYFEVWNESSWMYSLGEGGYNELYSYTVKGLLAGDANLKVGGPAASAASSPGQIKSLVSYAKTNSLKLSFVSYHSYSNDNGARRADPASMLSFHKSLTTTIKSTGFTGEILNDEWGPSYDADVVRDSEASTSFIAKTIHLIGTDTTAPPGMYGYWTISDLYEEFDTGGNLAYREGNYGLMLKGDARYAQSFDVAKPAFNAFRLLHLMGDTLVSTTGGSTADGVNAVATVSSDNNSIRILVYNHVAGGTADSSTSKMVKLTVNNLPFTSAPSVRHYLVDRNHSNSYRSWVTMGKPKQPNAAQWTTLSNDAELCYYGVRAALTGNSWTITYPQNTYGVSLIVLSR